MRTRTWKGRFLLAITVVLSVLLPLASGFPLGNSSGGADPPNYAECKNAYDTQSPACHNSGYLRSYGNSSSINCASCVCPDGWHGLDCSVCRAKEVCPPLELPDGSTLEAVNCTSSSLYPTKDEEVHGKTLSCTCGGDEQTESYCNMQPQTGWIIDIRGPLSTKEGYMTMSEYAGMPVQNTVPYPFRYNYSYPYVWEYNVSRCGWEIQDCIMPLGTPDDDCLVFTCEDGAVQCPPPGVEPCPGFAEKGGTGCATAPGTDPAKPWWQHHCNVLAIPVPGGAQLFCRTTPADTGGEAFHCFFKQPPPAFSAGIGMMCVTGGCQYNKSATPQPGPRNPKRFRHAEPVTLAAMGAAFLAAVWVVMLYTRRENREWQVLLPPPNSGEQEVGEQEEGGTGVHRRLGSMRGLAGGSGGASLVLSWRGICYSLKPSLIPGGHKRRQILKGVHGAAGVEAGAGPDTGGGLLAIMGPSGAGKTTLLDCLAGRNMVGDVSGEIRADGALVRRGDMSRLSGYVLQDDVLPGTSTVLEFLLFHCALRLPAEISHEERERRVGRVVHELGLAKVAHSFIGDDYVRGLSGGEKRRVSIGAELLTRPGVMFLDEPTTGLDSTNAAKVVDILADLSHAGVTVVLSIHQPRADVLRLLDRVLVLSGSGQVVYSGRTSRALEHFASLGYQRPDAEVNAADYILDTVIKSSGSTVARMVEVFASSPEAEEESQWVLRLQQGGGAGGGASVGAGGDAEGLPAAVAGHSKKVASFSRQVRVLSGRLLNNIVRHPFLVCLHYVATLFMAICVGLIYKDTGYDTGGIQDRLGALFFMLLYLSLMSLSSLPIWRDERLLFVRERASGVYGTPAYFCSVVLFDIVPMRVVPPYFFALFSYWMIDLHNYCATCIGWLVLVLILANIAATLLCMAIGAAAPSNAVANVVGSLSLMIFALFGGFLLNKDKVPPYVQWMADASFLKYAYEALAINEFDGPAMFTFTSPLPSSKLPDLRVQGTTVLREFGFHREFFFADLFAIVALAGLFGAAAYLLLASCDVGLVAFLRARLMRGCAADTWRPLEDHAASPAGGASASAPAGARRYAGGGAGGDPEAGTAGAAGAGDMYEGNNEGSNDAPDTSTVPLLSSADDTFSDAGMSDFGCMSDVGDSASVLSDPGYQGRLGAGGGGGSAGSPRGVVLSWSGVQYSVPAPGGRGRKLILDGVCGIAGVRERERGSGLFAILGPSGAGKTTLIDLLAGRRMAGEAAGEIRVDGRLAGPETVRKISGYVHQTDVLPGTSTVLEYMLFHAKVRMPRRVTAERRAVRVWQILRQLGLAKVAHSFIGDDYVRGLSGGEKRRVSIGAELLTRPGVMFLDEPTTGLDSTNAAKVVDILAELGGYGVTTVISIHQPRPDIFRLLDRVLFLSGSGQVVYSGPTLKAPDHFRSLGYPGPSAADTTFADYMLDRIIKAPDAEVGGMVSRYALSEVAEADREAVMGLQQVAGPSEWGAGDLGARYGKYRSSFLTQLGALSARLSRNIYRHPFLICLHYVATLFMAICVGLIYKDTGYDTGGIQDRLGALFFMLLYLSLMSLSSLPIWRDERLLFVRERAAGAYGADAYFSAVVLFDIVPMRILPPLLFGFTYRMIGLQEAGDPWHLPTCLGLLVLTNIVAASMSMAIGAAAPSNAVANVAGSLCVLFTALFGGILLNRDAAQSSGLLRTISRASYTSYAFEALLINEFHNQTGYAFTSYADKSARVDVTGDVVLETFGFDPFRMKDNCHSLAAMAIVWLAVSYLCLKFKRGE